MGDRRPTTVPPILVSPPAASTATTSTAASSEVVANKRGLSLSARLPPWATKARVMAAPVLVAFLSFLFVAVHDLNHLGGEFAFLCYTSVVLFFFPRGRVSQQIENNTTNFFGAVVGLGWTSAVVAVAGWCGKNYGSDASQSRAVLGTGLAVLSLVCGTLRSYAPRLNVACRAAMFYPIFVLTSQQTTTGFTASVFLHPFFVALFAYAFSTVVGVVLSEHSSSPQLGAQILKSVRITCDLLPMSLTTILDADEIIGSGTAPSSTHSSNCPTPLAGRALEEQQQQEGQSTWTRQQKLARTLRNEVRAVRNTHADYSLDIVHARQEPKALQPVIRALGRLQRNAILGPTGHVPGERIRTALERAYATPATSRHTSMSGTPRRSRSREGSQSVAGSQPGSRPGSVHEHISATQLASQLSRVATHHHGGMHRPSPAKLPSPARVRLTQTCNGLSDAIVSALNYAAVEIAISCDWLHEPEINEKAPQTGQYGPTAEELKRQLRVTLADLEKRLSGIIDAGDFGASTPNGSVTPVPTTPVTPRTVVFEDQMTSADWLDDDDRFRIAFYMIALLDLAKETTSLLDYAVHLRAESDKPKRWIFPSIIWPWTKVTPDMPILPVSESWSHRIGGGGMSALHMPASPEAASVLPAPKDSADPMVVPGELPPGQQDDDDEEHHEDLDFVHSVLHQEVRPRPHGRNWKARGMGAWRSIWDRHGVVFARVAISKTLHQLKHSRHVHFALKQTVGISLLSLPAFLPLGNAGRSWYDSSRGPWMVVSFMYVIEVTTGATLRIGFFRLLGTFTGALVGYICVVIARENAYGLVTLATACSVPISYIILFTSIAPFGVITGITLPPIVFIEYLHLDNGHTVFRLAWERFVDIAIGIGAAVIIGIWLWPIHARVRYFRAVAETMDQITEYYLRMSRDLLRPGLVYHANNRHYRSVELAVRRQITHTRSLVEIQRQEISLLPRPIKLYSEVIDLMERLLETFTEVRTLRFSLPRKATVLDVLPIRRELVSAILVNLWATSQAFRSRSPLPQLLPSPRVPLGEVMETTDEHAHAVRARRARANLRRRYEYDDGDDDHTGAGNRDHDVFVDNKDHRHSDGVHRHRHGHPNGREGQHEGIHAELSVLYGMAENEALGEAINSIDELLAAARTLFGTQAFLDVNVSM